MTTSADDSLANLWKLIHGIRFAMLTTQSETGDLRARPLTTQNRSEDDGNTVWFFVAASSEAAKDVRRQPNVNLAYESTDDDHFVSISGRARLVDDPARKQALWSPMVQAWFPGGANDPEVTLLAVDLTQAEYWNVKNSKLVQLFKMAKAAVTGHPPVNMGEHRHVQVS